MDRTLYIICYDITDQRRLKRVRDLLKGYSTGGQKSVYECFLTRGEIKLIIRTLRRMIREAEDRVHIFQMDARSKSHTLGIAIKPKDPSFFYIG
ncbi:MAG: CRISPR-associated endonuclease Cas2 [Desulfatiglandales bacterium]